MLQPAGQVPRKRPCQLQPAQQPTQGSACVLGQGNKVLLEPSCRAGARCTYTHKATTLPKPKHRLFVIPNRLTTAHLRCTPHIQMQAMQCGNMVNPTLLAPTHSPPHTRPHTTACSYTPSSEESQVLVGHHGRPAGYNRRLPRLLPCCCPCRCLLLLLLAACVPLLPQPALHNVQQLLARLQCWQDRPGATCAHTQNTTMTT
jgi:hypothetical protein